MTYYQMIDGVRYSRDLLDAARRFTQGRGESRISESEIQELYRMAEDGRRITDVERRTLLYIRQNFTLTDKARAWLEAKMPNQGNGQDLSKGIARIIREEYGLKNLSWQIDPEEVRLQEQLGGLRLFESALRGALEAFLRFGQGQFSFSAFVSRRDLAFQSYPTPEELLKAYLDKGTLYLLPQGDEAQAALEFDLPPNLDFTNNWIFVLQIPDFYPALFVARVLRSQQRFQFSTGYISQRPELENLIPAIVRQFLGFSNLEWVIDPAEVERQLALMPGQNFGEALFAALHAGIFNGESSFSFRDFIRNEVWVDPDRSLNDYMREYINTGTLHLIPLDFREQGEAGLSSFPLPESFSPWMEGEWYFGLEMPRKTNARFLINLPRDYQDGQTGWNDGFLIETLSLEERIQQVLKEEFQLPGLQVIFPGEELAAQQQQFGPEWRTGADLLRQALNTILDDYLDPRSVFNLVAQKHREEIDPSLFDLPLEYRVAIRHRIRLYLQTGTLEFLPVELPDNNPINGESIEESWQFFIFLPDLWPTGFWVIIPRWPDDEQRPFVYGDWAEV